MNTAQLILGIVQAFAQFGPGLVKSATDLIHGNPKLDKETDEEYVARINAMIDAKAADTAAQDAIVEKGQ